MQEEQHLPNGTFTILMPVTLIEKLTKPHCKYMYINSECHRSCCNWQKQFLLMVKSHSFTYVFNLFHLVSYPPDFFCLLYNSYYNMHAENREGSKNVSTQGRLYYCFFSFYFAELMSGHKTLEVSENISIDVSRLLLKPSGINAIGILMKSQTTLVSLS